MDDSKENKLIIDKIENESTIINNDDIDFFDECIKNNFMHWPNSASA